MADLISAPVSHTQVQFSEMFLVAVCLASCRSSTPAQLRLMEVHFQNSRDLTGPEALAGGSLIDLISTSAMMSKVLVTGSRTGRSLVRGISSFIQIEKCEYSGLEDTFGSFSQGTVTVNSSRGVSILLKEVVLGSLSDMQHPFT